MGKIVADMDDNTIIKLYKEGKSLASLSRLTGISTYKIRQLLVNNNISIRTQAQQNFYSNQECSLSVNASYFNNIDNPKKAWIVGFLAADGTISSDRNTIKIGLATKDREILEKIRTEIQIERKILNSETNKGYEISELVWSNANHKRQLQKYGIIPKKIYHPITVPNWDNQLQLAFILGYFDGDGCFKDDGATCRWEICSYRPENLESIAKILNPLTNMNRNVYADPSRKNYYTLTYSTEGAFKILSTCYNICPLYLNRKKQKFIIWAKRNQRI